MLMSVNGPILLINFQSLTIAEWIDRDQHMSNIGLYPSLAYPLVPLLATPQSVCDSAPYINLVMIEPEFQVIVDRLVRNLAEQREV